MYATCPGDLTLQFKNWAVFSERSSLIALLTCTHDLPPELIPCQNQHLNPVQLHKTANRSHPSYQRYPAPHPSQDIAHRCISDTLFQSDCLFYPHPKISLFWLVWSLKSCHFINMDALATDLANRLYIIFTFKTFLKDFTGVVLHRECVHICNEICIEMWLN